MKGMVFPGVNIMLTTGWCSGWAQEAVLRIQYTRRSWVFRVVPIVSGEASQGRWGPDMGGQCTIIGTSSTDACPRHLILPSCVAPCARKATSDRMNTMR